MTAKMHRMHFPNVGEGVLHIPGGVPYEVVPVAEALTRYIPGSYVRLGNKGFVYATAGNSLIPDVGAKQANNQKIGNVAIAVKALVGATELKITSDVSVTEDQLKGGEVVVFPGPANKAFTRGIIGNDEMTATATLTLQLDSPIPCEVVVAGSSAEVMLNPYVGVMQENNEWRPVMGMPTVVATVGQGLWLQVEGISWCAPEAEVGAAVNDLEVCFAGNGSLMRRDTNALGQQRAGMVIAPNKTGNGQGAPFIMLNIDH